MVNNQTIIGRLTWFSKTNDNKIIGWIILLYGAYYLFVLHEEIMMYGIDWKLMGWFGLEGFSHQIHKLIGMIMIIYGSLLLFDKMRIFKNGGR